MLRANDTAQERRDIVSSCWAGGLVLQRQFVAIIGWHAYITAGEQCSSSPVRSTKLTGRERNEGESRSIVLGTTSDMCFLFSQRTLFSVLRSTDGSWSQGRICRCRQIGQRVARRCNASAIQAAGFNVRSEVPSHGYFHVMREVLMYLPGRAMACAG
jgi:hypothetical protein